MGAGVSTLFLDENNKEGGIGFAKAMFSMQEWTFLKKICDENNIVQSDLNRVFNKHFTDENVQLRQMRADLSNFKLWFVDHCNVNKEAVDVLVPEVFLREMPDCLDPPYSPDEVSFARFVVMGFTFCAQPIQDTMYDFISISKRNRKVQLKATMFTYNLNQIISTLSEELEKSAALDYCIKRSNVQNDMEISIESVMRIAVKYPVGFFQLIRFRKKFRRLFFGDRFWEGRRCIKSRFFLSSARKMSLLTRSGRYSKLHEPLFSTSSSARRSHCTALRVKI